MTRQETIFTIKDYLSQYPIRRIGVFGSFAREEERPDSDIDILVGFTDTIDLFTLVRMHRELSELLHRKVDIVTEKALHPAFKPYIEKDLQIITEA
ncbi:MAG: nucleotidyltransferase family protein [Leptospira sp.]|nr:nucleotidyltransferase family protein [Leptospira sp.]